MFYSVEQDGLLLQVHVSPKARKNQIIGEFNGALKVAVAAVPENGKANKLLLEFLAKELAIPKSTLRLIHGDSSKKKTIRIASSDLASLISKLTKYNAV